MNYDFIDQVEITDQAPEFDETDQAVPVGHVTTLRLTGEFFERMRISIQYQDTEITQ